MKRRQPIKWSLVFILLVVLTRRAYTQEGQDTPSFNVGDDPKFTYLTPNEGLSSEYVSAIVQDSQGFMWFGTESGLNRYDLTFAGT